MFGSAMDVFDFSQERPLSCSSFPFTYIPGSRVYGQSRNRTGGALTPFIARVKRFDLQFRRLTAALSFEAV